MSWNWNHFRPSLESSIRKKDLMLAVRPANSDPACTYLTLWNLVADDYILKYNVFNGKIWEMSLHLGFLGKEKEPLFESITEAVKASMRDAIDYTIKDLEDNARDAKLNVDLGKIIDTATPSEATVIAAIDERLGKPEKRQNVLYFAKIAAQHLRAFADAGFELSEYEQTLVTIYEPPPPQSPLSTFSSSEDEAGESQAKRARV